MVAHSIVFDGDMDVANDYRDPTNLVFDGHLEAGAHARPGIDGRLRPMHDVGLPILFSPYFALAYRIAQQSPQWLSPRTMARARLNPWLVLRHLISLGMTAIAALTAVWLFRICRPAFDSQSHSVFWVVLFALSPPLLSHAFLFFTETPTALIVAVCWLALASSDEPGPLGVGLLGAAVGLLPLIHMRNVGLAVGLAALFAVRWWRSDDRVLRLSSFVVVLAACAAIRTGINLQFWGTVLTNPQASPEPIGDVWQALGELLTRTFGLVFDQEHGLLPYAPIYLLALPGLLLVRTEDRATFRRALVLLLAYLVPVLLPGVNKHGWSGGWSPAARFLVPIAPVLVVLSCRYVARLSRVPVAVTVLAVIQIALNLVYWSRPKVLWNLGTGRSALATWLSTSHLQLSDWLPSWHVPSLASVVASVAATMVWIVVSVAMVRRSRRPNPTASPSQRPA